MVYVDNVTQAAKAWSLRPVTSGGNVLLAEPESDVVFQRTTLARSGVIVAAAAQVAVDLTLRWPRPRKTVISRLILESCAAIRGSRWPWSGRVSTQTPSPVSRAPGWIPLGPRSDLMVPEDLAGPGGRDARAADPASRQAFDTAGAWAGSRNGRPGRGGF